MVESEGKAQKAARLGRWWPYAIIGMLALHATALLVVVRFVAPDPTFAVEPNHYQKAIAWDQSAGQTQANKELGWRAEVEADAALLPSGRRQLRCRLLDRDGKAIPGALVQVLTFHHARAAERIQAPLLESPEGDYRAELFMARAGLWEVRVQARALGATFTSVALIQVGAPR